LGQSIGIEIGIEIVGATGFKIFILASRVKILYLA